MGTDNETELGIDTSSSAWMQRREAFYDRAFGLRKEPGVFHWDDDYNPHIDVYTLIPHNRPGEIPLLTGGMADRAQPGTSPDHGCPGKQEQALPRLPEDPV